MLEMWGKDSGGYPPICSGWTWRWRIKQHRKSFSSSDRESP
jgi:hypothetical protein